MIFLRFPDKQTYLNAIATYIDDEGNITLPNVDVIGLIYEDGTYDAEGNVIESPTPIAGWHVNVIGDLPPEFDPYVIDKPNKPYRIFAGH